MCKPFFFPSYSGHKREIMFPGVPSGDLGNWKYERLCNRSHACFAKKAQERLMRPRAFPERCDYMAGNRSRFSKPTYDSLD